MNARYLMPANPSHEGLTVFFDPIALSRALR